MEPPHEICDFAGDPRELGDGCFQPLAKGALGAPSEVVVDPGGGGVARVIESGEGSEGGAHQVAVAGEAAGGTGVAPEAAAPSLSPDAGRGGRRLADQTPCPHR